MYLREGDFFPNRIVYMLEEIIRSISALGLEAIRMDFNDFGRPFSKRRYSTTAIT